MKVSFKVTQRRESWRTVLGSLQESYIVMNNIWHCNLISCQLYAQTNKKLSNSYGKKSQKVTKILKCHIFCTIRTFKNDPWSYYIKSVFWQLNSTLLGKLLVNIGEMYSTVFEKIASKWKMSQFGLLLTFKISFKTVQSNQYFCSILA